MSKYGIEELMKSYREAKAEGDTAKADDLKRQIERLEKSRQQRYSEKSSTSKDEDGS